MNCVAAAGAHCTPFPGGVTCVYPDGSRDECTQQGIIGPSSCVAYPVKGLGGSPPKRLEPCRVVAGQRYAARMDVHLAARLRKLVASGCSIRSAARELGVSRSAAMRAVSAAPVIDLADEYDDGDPWTDDDDELPLALMADDATEREPHEVLTPPFEFAGLADVPDNMPIRRRDGKLRQAPQWTDAHGQAVSEVDLWRYGHRLHDIVPGDYPDRETYLAAWDAANTEIEAVRAHAWDALHAAGVVYDDARGLWLQRPQAV